MSTDDTLDRIPRGARVRVVAVNSQDSDPLPNAPAGNQETGPETGIGAAIARRLDDLGIRKGVALEVIRRAPLGDPTVYELHGYQLCLRKSESSRVRVEPEPVGAKPK
jgi:ferrous iron transport protein A